MNASEVRPTNSSECLTSAGETSSTAVNQTRFGIRRVLLKMDSSWIQCVGLFSLGLLHS
jgi:hypothetical protein